MEDTNGPEETKPQRYTHRLNYTKDKIALKKHNIVSQFLQNHNIYSINTIKKYKKSYDHIMRPLPK